MIFVVLHLKTECSAPVYFITMLENMSSLGGFV